MCIDQIMERFRKDLDVETRRAVGGRSLPLYNMVRYHLGWVDANGKAEAGESGKRLRPLLCLLACESVAGDHRMALPAAAALELVHNFTLVHDDVMDRDRSRRHRPTVWSIWGPNQAINVGDLLYSLGNSALSRLPEAGVSQERSLRAISRLQETCVQVVEGQFLDLAFESRPTISVDEYLDMIGKKSAALISCALVLGALAGGADSACLDAFAAAGFEMGLAFQIRDDILGIWGDPLLTGKPVGGDIRRKKKSLPAVCAFDSAAPHASDRLRAIYSSAEPSADEIDEALRLMDELRVREKVQILADQHSTAAIAAVHALPIGNASKDELEALVNLLAGRES